MRAPGGKLGDSSRRLSGEKGRSWRRRATDTLANEIAQVDLRLQITAHSVWTLQAWHFYGTRRRRDEWCRTLSWKAAGSLTADAWLSALRSTQLV